MLSLFPQLLFLAPLSATILRIAVGITFLTIAYVHWKRREEISQTRFPIIGSGALWIYIALTAETLLGAMLIVGYATQLAALLGFLMTVKHAVFAKKYPRAIPLCRGEYLLLAAICLSLLFTGAGAFAYDWPL